MANMYQNEDPIFKIMNEKNEEGEKEQGVNLIQELHGDTVDTTNNHSRPHKRKRQRHDKSTKRSKKRKIPSASLTDQITTQCDIISLVNNELPNASIEMEIENMDHPTLLVNDDFEKITPIDNFVTKAEEPLPFSKTLLAPINPPQTKTEHILPNIICEIGVIDNNSNNKIQGPKVIMVEDISAGNNDPLEFEKLILKSIRNSEILKGKEMDIESLIFLLLFNTSIKQNKVTNEKKDEEEEKEKEIKSLLVDILPSLKLGTLETPVLLLDPLIPKNLRGYSRNIDEILVLWNSFYKKVLAFFILSSVCPVSIIHDISFLTLIMTILYKNSIHTLFTIFLIKLHISLYKREPKTNIELSPHKLILTLKDNGNLLSFFNFQYTPQYNRQHNGQRGESWEKSHKDAFNEFYANKIGTINTKTNTLNYNISTEKGILMNQIHSNHTNNNNNNNNNNNKNNESLQKKTLPVSFENSVLLPLNINENYLILLFSLESLLKYPQYKTNENQYTSEMKTKNRLCLRQQYKFSSKELDYQIPSMNCFDRLKIATDLISHFIFSEITLLGYLIQKFSWEDKDGTCNIAQDFGNTYNDKRFESIWNKPLGIERKTAEVFCDMIRFRITNQVPPSLTWNLKQHYFLFSHNESKWQISNNLSSPTIRYITEAATNQKTILRRENHLFQRNELVWLKMIEQLKKESNTLRNVKSPFKAPGYVYLREFVLFCSDMLEYDIRTSIKDFERFLVEVWEKTEYLPVAVLQSQTIFYDVGMVVKIIYILFMFFGYIKILYDVSDMVNWKSINNFYIQETFLGIINNSNRQIRSYLLIMKNNHIPFGCKIYKIIIKYSNKGGIENISKQLFFEKEKTKEISIEYANKMLPKVLKAYTSAKWT